MEKISTWSDLFFQSFAAFGEKLMTSLPSVLGAMFILLFGWLFARLISGGIRRLLKAVKFNKLAENVNFQEFLQRANITLSPSLLISKFVYWILMLLVIITASETLGWSAVSEEISKLIAYLPQLLAAVVFFIVGVYIATFVRDVINGATHTIGISTGKAISMFVFYMLLILVSLTALKQAGIDTSIITSNLLVIIGSIMIAVAISYGFASRDILSNILGSYFSRRTFEIGQRIEIDGKEGEITDITSVTMTIKLNNNRDLVIPANQLMTKQIEIIKQ